MSSLPHRAVAGVIGYAAALLVMQEFAGAALDAMWSTALTVTAWLRAALGGVLGAAVAVVSDPGRLLTVGLPTAVAITAIALCSIAKWLVWPAICAHAGATRGPASDGQVIPLPTGDRASGPLRRAA